ncbi:MAG TPA: lysophospholipid acyltransferase family protein [Chthoniobacterales bacterium]|nr:lysophospholipid acyltransferase family protein [Chthoniobacterales bacterium]
MNPWYFTIYHLTRLIARVLFRFRVIHPERVIQEGPVILAMNHESYLDPPFAGIACRRAIYFLARKSLLDVPVLGWVLPKLNVIPVDQEGGDRSALKALIRTLRVNHGALVFPEGSRTLDGQLQPPQPGLGFVIAKTLAPVVPMRIFGAHRALPRGGGKLRFCPITIVVGEPLHFTAADLAGIGREVYPRLSARVMEAIAALKLE